MKISFRWVAFAPLLYLAGGAASEVGAVAAPGADSGPPALQGSRPNILVVMADDLDVTSMQVLLEQDLMPNLERYVIETGTSFTESFVTNAICCPSRATYLTGQYSHNHRTFSNTLTNGAVLAFDDDETIGTWLQAAGYRTAHVGKYLNGYGLLWSFQGNSGLRALVQRSIAARHPDAVERVEPGYVPPGWSGWYGLIDLSTYCVFDYAMNENGRVRAYYRDGRILEDGRIVREATGGTTEQYQTDVLADKAVEFLEDHWSRGDSAPFFLSVMPLAPHVEKCQGGDPEIPEQDPFFYKDQFKSIIRPAPRHRPWVDLLSATARSVLPGRLSYNETLLEDKPRVLSAGLALLTPDEENALFAQFGHRLASMMAVDDLLGRIVQALEDRSELDRTFIVFTSDNGWFNGEHRLSSKGLAYEEAVRVPLFVRTPGRLGPRVESRASLNNDLAPTFLDLAAGTATLSLDGRSLLPLLDGYSPSVWRERFVVEHFSGFPQGSRHRPVDPINLFGIRTTATSALPNRTYVEYYEGVQFHDGYRRGFGSMRAGFLWQSAPSARELYSLVEDPYQIENRWPRRLSRTEGREIREEAATLRRWMLELLSCSGADCQTLENP